SSEDNVGTPAGRVILFGTIPTTIPDTTLVITPPTTQTDTTVIPTETPIIAPTIPSSLDYTPTSLDYSPASETESDPSEDPSSGYIPPLTVVSPFLSSDDDTTNNSSSRHSLSDHSSLDLLSTSAGPSRKRRRVRDISYLANVEVGPRETRVERVTHPAMPEDIPEPAQEGAVLVTYETLVDLVQRFHDHTQAILVHRIQAPFGGVTDWYQKPSVGTPAGRVILFDTILTTIPDTTLVITSPTTQTDTTVIPTETPIIAPTIPPSPDYTLTSLDYSPASETESDPSEDPSSGYIPPLPVPIPHGRLYRYYPNGSVNMMTERKRVGPLPIQQLTMRHYVDHSSSDSSSRHSLSDHSSLDLLSTSARPSHKRRRSPMTSEPALPPVGPRETRVERVTHPAMPEDIPELAQEGAVLVTYETLGHRIVGVESSVTALTERVVELERDNRRLGGTASVESQRVDRLQRGMSQSDPSEDPSSGYIPPLPVVSPFLSSDDDTIDKDIPEPAQEGAVLVTYETLVDLVQRFHDHTQAILVHRIQVGGGEELLYHHQQTISFYHRQQTQFLSTTARSCKKMDSFGYQALPPSTNDFFLPPSTNVISFYHRSINHVIFNITNFIMTTLTDKAILSRADNRPPMLEKDMYDS
nr:hypothetical protein [Tanacetum cinerariifolium]